ncbi:MAG: NADH:ubiquinone reductase (Na(+)-transporting) subunit B [Bacteroidales bacterium]|nr:NADH:ubiquinone reductase (Na(+)-transporting) subunit B [Bacteroidales bacterium]
MKIFKDLIDKTKPQFLKGGKYEKWHSVYESFETFLFVPAKVTNKGSHIRDAIDLKRAMSIVIIALLPALLFGMWNVGSLYYLSIGQADATLFQSFAYGFLKVLPLIVVSYGVGLGVEFIFVYIKGHEINEGFLVSGMLIPMIMPIDIPLWMLAVATAFAVVIGKEVFGGTGMNLLNPALLARAFLFFAYPSKISGNTIWVSQLSEKKGIVDGFSGETILGQKINGVFESYNGFVGNKIGTWDMFLGNIPGSIGETSTLAILIGAAILLYTGIASFRIMFSVFMGGLIMGSIIYLFGNPENALHQISPIQHLFIGGFAFGAVFMATDPVTGSQTGVGKWIYGFLIGIFAIIIRCLNPAYPEGMMLAILLMNVFAPLIDNVIIQKNIKRRLKRSPIVVSEK